MLALGVIAATATAATAALALLLRRRHRGGLLAPLRPRPAGAHLRASSLAEPSDLGLHLDAARPAGRPRLGATLDPR